jgi:hypothetical protein
VVATAVLAAAAVVVAVAVVMIGLQWVYKKIAGQVHYIQYMSQRYIHIMYITLAGVYTQYTEYSTLYHVHQLVFSAYCSTAAHCWPLK